MVKAILDERKTQTRRVFSKTQLKYFDYAQKLGEMSSLDNLHENDFAYILQFSQYKAGDVLYVRETFYPLYNDKDSCVYKADYPLHWTAIDAVYGDIETDTETEKVTKWKPSIHMPKKYARIFLKVTNVRVERLQDITRKDVLSEGIREHAVNQFHPHTCLFETLWNSTAKDGYKWEDNPFVFVYEFERIVKED